MRKLMLFLAGVAGLAMASPVLAAPAHTYRADLDRLTADFNAIGFPGVDKPGATVRGANGHSHAGAQVNYMAEQIRLAYVDCNAGNDAAVRQRIDLVRAALGHGSAK
jgi:hypothetical protein